MERMRACARTHTQPTSNSIEKPRDGKKQVDDRKHNVIYDVDTKNASRSFNYRLIKSTTSNSRAPNSNSNTEEEKNGGAGKHAKFAHTQFVHSAT